MGVVCGGSGGRGCVWRGGVMFECGGECVCGCGCWSVGASSHMGSRAC